MILRLMLVGMVASLGVEPASPDDLVRWMEEGRAWCLAQVLGIDETDISVAPDDADKAAVVMAAECELAAPAVIEAPLAEVVAHPAAAIAVDDEIFAAITDEMADGFMTDW